MINYYGLVPLADISHKTSLFRHHHSAHNYNSNNNDNSQDIKKKLAFKQWLGGLIDGDGYFILTKKGYTNCEITMDARDKKALNKTKIWWCYKKNVKC